MESSTRHDKNPYKNGTMRLVRKSVPIAVAFAAVYYIWNHFEWLQIFYILQNANLDLFLGWSIGTILAFFLLRAIRWQLLVDTINVRCGSFLHLYLCTSYCLALSNITPAQSGEALKVEMLRRVSGLQRFEGYACFAAERLLDIICVLQLATAVLILGVGRDLGLSVFILALVVMAVIFSSIAVAFLLTRVGPWKSRAKAMLGKFATNPARLALGWSLSMGSWLVVVLGWGACLSAVGISLSFVQLLFLTSSVVLVNIFSFIPGGLGVSEVTTAILLGNLGIPSSIGQAAAIAIRAYGLATLILGLLHFAFWRMLKKATIKYDSEN